MRYEIDLLIIITYNEHFEYIGDITYFIYIELLNIINFLYVLLT